MRILYASVARKSTAATETFRNTSAEEVSAKYNFAKNKEAFPSTTWERENLLPSATVIDRCYS